MAKEIIKPSQFGKANLVEDLFHDLHNTIDQNNDLKALYDNFFDTCKIGRIVQGKIIDVSSDGVRIDINYKSESLIPRYEFTQHELKALKPGDNIEVILDELESVDGVVVLSYEKAKALKAWDIIHKLFEEEKPVDGIVTHKVKGGLSVDIGIPAFLPGSQVDVQRVTNFDQYVGQTITANIIKINKKRGNVIISRRKYLSDQRTEVRKMILDTLVDGQIIKGQVKNITNYGVFIDIGGVDGLLHITDMTWGRISHPSEIVKIGDSIDVKVLSFDKNNEKISLGLKQLSNNPWEQLDSKVQVGSLIKGKISSITDYGLFVEINKGVEGLIHISEVSWTDRIHDLRKHYNIGDEVEAIVISIDKEMRRMSLSIKQRSKNPWEAVSEEFSLNQVVKGTISNVTDFGIFVQLKPGIDGLVHVSDLSWTDHIEHPNALYAKGQEIEAIILSIDIENKKISLGIKQLQQDPWSHFETTNNVGDIIEGEISKVTNFGIFVKIGNGIEGLVHVSEVNNDRRPDQKIEDVFKPGTMQQFRIVKISKEERKIALSQRLSNETLELSQPIQKLQQQPRAEIRDQREPNRNSRKENQGNMQREEVSFEQIKTKNPLQIELEKHTSRQQEQAKESKK